MKNFKVAPHLKKKYWDKHCGFPKLHSFSDFIALWISWIKYYCMYLSKKLEPSIWDDMSVWQVKSPPNLHHPTENWRETVTNFPFDPLLIPICSTQDWPPLIIGSMAKWNVLPIWDCCCAVISTAVHNFTVLSIPEMEKKIYYFESFVVALIRA